MNQTQQIPKMPIEQNFYVQHITGALTPFLKKFKKYQVI